MGVLTIFVLKHNVKISNISLHQLKQIDSVIHSKNELKNTVQSWLLLIFIYAIICKYFNVIFFGGHKLLIVLVSWDINKEISSDGGCHWETIDTTLSCMESAKRRMLRRFHTNSLDKKTGNQWTGLIKVALWFAFFKPFVNFFVNI